jgi:hypothetical protein
MESKEFHNLAVLRNPNTEVVHTSLESTCPESERQIL